MRTGLRFVGGLLFTRRIFMRTAFVVDDNVDTTVMLQAYLRSQGIACRSYNEFDSAYKAIANDHPCIVLIDLNVPGRMNASEFITRTKSEHPILPVVIISTDPKAQTVADSLQAHFLLKPFTIDEVLDKVREACPIVI
jgi:DNA-binding NtrC family response regulator